MKKTVIHGLPITPRAKIEELAGGSFCVSYATCSKRTVDDAIRLVGKDSIVMLDNGAYSHWKAGKGKINIDKFETWANEIMARCDNAIAVIPDVIGGSEAENDELINTCWLDWDRCMVVWHMHESIKRLLWLCESFNYVAFGSTTDEPGTAKWHAKMREAFAAIDTWEANCEGAYCRPRIHMMRAQAFAHEYPFDSSDSCTVALGHWRERNAGIGVRKMAARINKRIQKSAGAESEHQIKRPLMAHKDASSDLALYALAESIKLVRVQPDLFERREAA
jgi:hypothetical protein